MIKAVILIIALFYFCTNTMSQNVNEMQKLLWIVDKWRASEGDKISVEEWVKASNELYTGSSTTHVKGEEVFRETLKIENTADGIFYVADVPHNPAPVKFMLTGVTDTSAVFENPEHDFPKKITYVNETGNLHAFIEGPGKDGQNKIIDFYFYKER